MFGFGKKKKKETLPENNALSQKPEKVEKGKNRVEKLVMGAILGVAIGSVIGISMGPKKDKKKKNILEQEKEEEPMKKIPNEIEEPL